MIIADTLARPHGVLLATHVRRIRCSYRAPELVEGISSASRGAGIFQADLHRVYSRETQRSAEQVLVHRLGNRDKVSLVCSPFFPLFTQPSRSCILDFFFFLQPIFGFSRRDSKGVRFDLEHLAVGCHAFLFFSLVFSWLHATGYIYVNFYTLIICNEVSRDIFLNIFKYILNLRYITLSFRN